MQADVNAADTARRGRQTRHEFPNIHLRAMDFALRKRPMKVILLIAFAASSILFTSCNSIIGLGRDMRIAGEAMEKAANKGSGGSSEDTSGAPVY
jgi:predicted small secreted protein